MPTDKQKFTTYCNIPVDDPAHPGEKRPCGHAIVVTSGLPTQQIGNDAEPKGRAFASEIMKHVYKRHSAFMNLATGISAQFVAFMLIGYCRCEDPGVHDFMGLFADHLQKLCTMPVNDAMIVQLVAALGLMEDPQRSKLIEALTYVRNFQLRKVTPQSPANTPELSSVAP